MSDIAIRIENLGKRYRYGGAAPLSANLRADVTDWVRGIVRGGKGTGGQGGRVAELQGCRVTEGQRDNE